MRNMGLYSVIVTVIFTSASFFGVVKGGQCVIKGQVNTQLPWYGYLLQKTFQTSDALVEYQISYPAHECCANLLVYYDDQINDLKESMSCKERENILPADNNQIISLSTLNSTKGCTLWHDSNGGEPLYVCTGERSFKSTVPKTWYFAISRCSDSSTSSMLNMNYYFNVTGFYGKCEPDPLSRTVIPAKETAESNFGVIIALGVVCGITTIVAIVFIVLFIFGRLRRNKNKKKTGSVTSSQATMTQDIFYVNPSLSDREHSDSQYSHSQSSGSENYYEVIPDRRSYESINTQLAMQGHNVRGHNHAGGHMREHRANIPPYILEDYPPPPYQPPPGQQNAPHQRHANSAHANHQTDIGSPNHGIPNVHVSNGRPVQMHPSGHPPVNVIHHQHHSMSGLQSANMHDHAGQTHPVHQGSRAGSAPVHSEQTPTIARPTPIYPANHGKILHASGPHNRGVIPSAPSAHQTLPQNGHIPNGHVNTHNGHVNVPNGHTNQGFQRDLSAGSKMNGTGNGQNIQLQTYGSQDQGHASGSTQNSRQVPSGNVAKLLHDAYRIQQFETTA